MTEEKQPEEVEVVYIGRVDLVGGKKGERWALASDVPGKTADQLQRLGGLFAADRAAPRIGGVYLARCELVEGRLSTLGVRKTFLRDLDGEVWAALRAIAKVESERERAAAAEKKAKAAPLADHATTLLAHIVAAAPSFATETVLQGLMSEVRSKARDIARKRK